MRIRNIVILLFLPVWVLAQKKRDYSLELGNKAFSEMQYSYAIAYYKNYLSKHPKDTLVIERIGYSYKMNNQYDSAIVYYEKLNEISSVKNNYLAELYANNRNYSKAIEAYTNLLANGVENERLAKVYKERIIGFKKYAEFLIDSIDYRIQYLSVNTSFNEYSPIQYKGGLVIESNRQKQITRRNEYGWDGLSYSKLYFISDTLSIKEDSLISKPSFSDKKLKRSIIDYSSNSFNDNSKLSPKFGFRKIQLVHSDLPLLDKSVDISRNYGAACFTSDGQKMYYTRNEVNNRGVGQLEIWEADLVNGSWGQQKKALFNKSGQSYFHPAINKEGNRLYFVSDMPGGYGGTDIYYADKDSAGKWGEPMNAGEVINSPLNELFPSFQNDKFYFSSNGHAGMGGLDIFLFTDSKDGFSATIKNLGYPINTSADDMSYTGRTEKGYFSSNRYGSDDVFAFQYQYTKIDILGNATITSQKGSKLTVKLFDVESGLLIDSSATNSIGDYVVRARPGKNLTITITYDTDHGVSQDIDTYNYNPVNGIPWRFEKRLSPIRLIVPLPNEERKQNFITDTASTIKNPKGVDSVKLNNSYPNGNDSNRINNEYSFQQLQINSSVNSTKYVVYYKLNKSYLSNTDKIVLDSLIAKLKRNPALFAVMGSFTDCLGSLTYNISLSSRRSTAVRKYLLSHGILPNRIRANHYGKNYLVRKCSTGKYNSKQQSVNRRTEVYLASNKNESWVALSHKAIQPTATMDAFAIQAKSTHEVKPNKFISTLLARKDSVERAIEVARVEKQRVEKVKKDSIASALIIAQQLEKRRKDSIYKIAELAGIEKQRVEKAKKDSISSALAIFQQLEKRRKDSLYKMAELARIEKQRVEKVKKDSIASALVISQQLDKRRNDSLYKIAELARIEKQRFEKIKKDSIASALVISKQLEKRRNDSLYKIAELARIEKQRIEKAKKDSIASALVISQQLEKRRQDSLYKVAELARIEKQRVEKIKRDSIAAALVIQQQREKAKKDSLAASQDMATRKLIAMDVRSQAEADSISQQELLAALDSLAKLKREQERIVEYLTKRINKNPIRIEVSEDSVEVEIYDSQIHDGDSVSVIYNKRLVVDRKELMVNKPISFKVRVESDERKNEMVIVAENLGVSPPNTAILLVKEKSGRRHEVLLNTDLTHNEVVYFIKIVSDKKRN